MKKKYIVFLTAVAVVVAAAALTCPREAQHRKAVMTVVADLLDDDLTAKASGGGGAFDVWAILASKLGTDVANSIMDTRFHVHNYLVLSVGTLDMDSKQEVISVGCFGHVSTFDKQQLIEALDKKTGSSMISF